MYSKFRTDRNAAEAANVLELPLSSPTFKRKPFPG